VAVGGTLVFGRRWTTFDLSRGAVIRRRGWLVPMQVEQRNLSEFNAVVIAFESGDSDSSDRYPVRLRAWTGPEFAISSPIRFGESRAQAEFLSRFLRLPLVDASTGNELVLDPERAGETLQDRLRSAGAAPERIGRPAAMRCQVTAAGPETTIVIPGRSSVLTALVLAMFAVVFLLVLVPNLLRFFRQTGTPEFVQFGLLGFVLLVFGLLPLLGAFNQVLAARKSKTVVRASPAGIAIEWQSGWRKRTTVIPAGDVLGIDYISVDAQIEPAQRALGAGHPGASRLIAVLKKLAPSKGLIIKTRQDLLTVGEGLPPDELRYLQSILTQALAGTEDVT